MSVRQTAYDTTACAGFLTAKTQEGLSKALIQRLIWPKDGEKLVVVQGGVLVDELVPSFLHPMVIDQGGEQLVAVDVRTTGRWDGAQGKFVVRDTTSYEAAMIRARLNEQWLRAPEPLRNMSSLPLNLYSNVLAEAITKRLALDPGDQFIVGILAGIFYLNQFWSAEQSANPSKEDKTYLVSALTRTLNFKGDAVYDVVEAHAGLSSLEAFCEACKAYTQSVRMRDLNVATLFGMIGGYWYGNNARELIAVALEHPPTWITLIYEAISNRGYRNAALTKVLDRGVYRKHTGQFVVQLMHQVA